MEIKNYQNSIKTKKKNMRRDNFDNSKLRVYANIVALRFHEQAELLGRKIKFLHYYRRYNIEGCGTSWLIL